MSKKYQFYSALLQNTLISSTRTREKWSSLLTVMARNYKYQFPDQVMIYAQKPSARACADCVTWNKKMNRWVKKGAHGIALIDTSSNRLSIRYVFDVSDTNAFDNYREVKQWAINSNNMPYVLESLAKNYAVSDTKLATSLEMAAGILAKEYWQEHRKDILYAVDGSYLGDYDELNVETTFLNAVKMSSSYVLFTRCGISTEDHFSHEDFFPIYDMNTENLVTALGTAVNMSSQSILRTIEKAVINYERKHKTNEDYTQPKRGLPHSQHLHSGERNGHDREVRYASQKLLNGEPSYSVQSVGHAGNVVLPSEGDRGHGESALGTYDADHGEGSGRFGSTESIRSDEMGGDYELIESPNRRNNNGRADLQLSLFPTEQEQIESIVEAESNKPFAFSLPVVRDDAAFEQLLFSESVSQKVIDDALCLGGNEPYSLERICAWFAKDYPLEQDAEFLRSEYGVSGKGFYYGSALHSVWFDEQGIRIDMGRTARKTGTLLTWADAAVRIRELLNTGRYAMQSVLDNAANQERKELAARLWYTVSDFSDLAREERLIPSILAIYDIKEGFPKNHADIQELLKDSDKVAALISEFQEFIERYAENPKLMRFRLRKRDEILIGLSGLLRPHIPFMADPGFHIPMKQFISNDEIDQLLINHVHVENQKYRIYSYFTKGHTVDERVSFLRHEYGIGGNGRSGFDTNHDSKGFSYSRKNEANIPYDKILLKWPDVEKRISELIRQGRYLSDEEIAIYPTLEIHDPSPAAFIEADDSENDIMDEIDPSELRERLERSGIVNGELVDPTALDNDPFIRRVMADVQRVTLQENEVVNESAPVPMNFHITDNHLGEGGAKTKYQMNVAAIRTLQAIEAENRMATADEQETLSRYVGWGGVADAFDETKDNWRKEYNELKSLLTDEEYESARASTLNAHYTSPTVIKAIYSAIEGMGFTTGNILEPACGIGNFFGLLPESMLGSKLYGVELDSLTGRIARQLYQKANIAVQGFEQTNLPDSFFDVAIGNVPFGDYGVADKRYDKNHFLIHDYFFAKALDKVRPGGVVAFVTSSGTMDKKNAAVRKYIAQRADLIGAVRLPNNAFLANAGTQVVADILFLQKHDRPIEVAPDWVHLGKSSEGYAINQYFVDNPHMVLGTLTEESTQFGKQECTCAPLPGVDLADQLRDAMANIHAEIVEYEREDALTEAITESIPADPDVRNFSFAQVEGKLYFRENSRMNKVDVSATAESRIKGMIELRDCTRRLIEYQLEGYPDEAISGAQLKLSNLYDSFTSKYGLLNSRANNMAFSGDSSYGLLCSLEVIDENGNLARKADMFTKRTIRQQSVITAVDTASEALAVSLAEKAHVDMPYMAELTGKTEQQLENELTGVIFRDFGNLDPSQMAWAFFDPARYPFTTADEFLSGDVRAKLKQVKGIYEMLYGHSSDTELLDTIKVHVDALEKVQPVDLTASEIDVRLGATWLPQEVIEEFIFELLKPSYFAKSRIKVHYSPYTGAWNIANKSADSSSVTANVAYGTQRINAYKIIEETLNLKDVRIFDKVLNENGNETQVLNKKETILAQQKQQAIKDAFRDWIWASPARRESLTTLYNEKFNSIRPREYDGSHIRFVGMNPELQLRPHQVNAIARILYGGNTLLAHVVGAGKTFEMVGAAMELKRLGLCQKSLFVVPNHLTEQWAAEFLQLYPAANILVATKKDFETLNRKKFCARIATGDYDAVIIGHSQFEKIPLSVERQRMVLQEQLDEIINGIADAKSAHAERFTVKQLERTKKSIKLKLDKLNDQTRKDDVVTFEELGVDRLFVDEAHFYKNLFLLTKMRNVAGLSQTEAQKSSDLFMKCRYLDELTDGRGIVFASGTPISNSMTEMFTMQRYLQYLALRRQGLTHFDAWASTFGETVTTIELAPEGTGYRAKTRFARFYNLPELITTFKQVADIQTADMLNLPVPKVDYHSIVIKPSEYQRDMVASFAERADQVRNGMVDPTVDNMLKITNDGRKLALDQRLVNAMLPDDEQSKVNVCTDHVYRIWEETKDKRLTQLVFCDLSTPQNDGTFNVYDDLKAKLIERGVPAEEIAFIHDANTEVKKAALFENVRKGRVRVMLGSTAKMGAGTNVQRLLVAEHHLDIPWRPSDIEQREGRAIRQGNDNERVAIYRYVTENTFDSYMWQTIENKQKFIAQIMTSKSPVRSCEDIDETALSYAEIKALATGNPHIKEKMDLEISVSRLKLIKASFQSQKYALEDSLLRHFPKEVKKTMEQIAGYKRDAEHFSQHKGADFQGMTLRGVHYADKKDAGTALIEACKVMMSPEPKEIGTYLGFSLLLSYDSFTNNFRLSLKGALSHTIILGGDIHGNIQRIDNTLEALPKWLANYEKALSDVQRQIENAKAELAKPFVQEDELREKLARLTELDVILNMDKKQNETIDTEPENEVAGIERNRDEYER